MSTAAKGEPRVAVVSTVSDRERVRPLIEALRKDGLNVGWDAELTAGTDWEQASGPIVSRAAAVVVFLSRSSLASENLRRTVMRATRELRLLIPVRLDALEQAQIAPITGSRLWVNYLTPDDLDGAVQAIRAAVAATMGAEPGGADSGAPQDPPPPGSDPAGPVILQTDQGSFPYPCSPLFTSMLHGAAHLQPTSSGALVFNLNFSTLVAGLFYYSGPWQQRVAAIASASGFRREHLQRLPSSSIVPASAYRTTMSAWSLLQSARSIARESGLEPDVQHLLAALAFEPAGHESDLATFGLDRLKWVDALIIAVVELKTGDEAAFRARRTALAAALTPPPSGDPHHDTTSTGPAVAADLWHRLTSEAQEAFAWASQAATPSVVTPASLFVGLFRTAADSERVWQALEELSPAFAGMAGAPEWTRLARSLGLRALGTVTPLTTLPAGDPAVTAALTRIEDLSVRYFGGPTQLIAGNAVSLALWYPHAAGQGAPIDAALNALGLSADAADRLLLAVQDGFDDLAPEIRALQEIRQARGGVTRWDRAVVSSDAVPDTVSADADLLDAARPAGRFARLLAAEDVAPPIAVGLFGNWGSGKTFFMRLMRDQISKLTGQETPAAGYVNRVVQIEFNAWHYHDTNLWASLAMRIFDELARELAGPTPSDVEKTRRNLHQQIESSKVLKSQATERRDEAVSRRNQAVTSLEQVTAERDARLRKSAGLRLVAAWKAIQHGEALKQFREDLQPLKKNFGISQALDAVDDVARLRHEVERTSGTALGLVSAISYRFRNTTATVKTVGLLLAFIVGVIAVGLGAERLVLARDLRPELSAAIFQVAAIVSGVAAWCGRRVHDLRSALDHLTQVEADLAKAERDDTRLGAAATEIEKLQQEIAALDRQIDTAAAEVSAAERAIADATEEIERINSGGLVYDFLQNRRQNASYVAQLGLISTIRLDFEKLGELLADFKSHGRGIDRIVLYIDDLDRCHPDKVVEVLQAVHLLLAFKLFNVVVGVDARWLERSLRRQYEDREPSDGRRPAGRDQADLLDPFSPQDYLEKIFQIPYALSPLGEKDYRQLVAGLMVTRADVRQSVAAEAERLLQEQARSDRLAAESAARSGADVPPTPSATATDSPVAGGQTAQAAQTQQQEQRRESEVSVPTSSGALYFEDFEEAFIQQLHPFIDRPRLAKRFVNLYRLLRVRADDDGESGAFAGSPHSHGYRAAATLLAINVGHPAVAGRVMQAIGRADSGSDCVEIVRSLSSASNGNGLAERDRGELLTVVAKLQSLEKLPRDIDEFRRWAPRVASYSFDWHRSDAPRPGVVAESREQAGAGAEPA